MMKNDQTNIIQRIREDGAFFYEEILGIKLWEKQKEIDKTVWNNRYTSIRSCNGAGKTFFIPRLALRFLIAFPDSIVINTAPTWRQIENQYWRNFRSAYEHSKYNFGGKIYKTQYNIDENWFALGVAANANNVANFQGWHSKNVMVIFDEASGIPPIIWEASMGAMSGGANVRFVAIGNPNSNTGPFADTFTDPMWAKIHISAFDIPNVKEKKQIIQGLSTWEWVEEMRKKYGEDSDIYRVRVLGEPPIAEADTLIPIGWVESAFTSEREMSGRGEILGVDVARFGDDDSALVYRKGNYAKVIDVIHGNDTMQIAGKVRIQLVKNKNLKAHIDIVGIGVGVFDRLREMPDIADRVFGVNNASAPENKDEYINVRVESWDIMKDWVRDAILEKHEGFYELAKPKYKITSTGKMQLESKEEMKKRGIPSPNVGDGLALTFAKPSEGGSGGVVWI